MKKVVIIQNPETKEASAVLVGETLDTMTMVLSKPDMNRRLGWINCLHDEILNTEFTVVATIQKDISAVEAKYHKLWKENKKEYSLDAYLFEAMCNLKHEIDEHFEASTEVENMMEIAGISNSVTTFSDLTSDIFNGRMLPSFADVLYHNNVDELVFKFEATDYIGWESVGYCIYNLASSELRCYISPVEFFEAIEGKQYGYCGHVYAHECMTVRDVLNDSAMEGIRKAVETRIMEFDDKEAADRRIEDAFKL